MDACKQIAEKPALMDLIPLLQDLTTELWELIVQKLSHISRIRLGAVSRSLRQITKRYENEAKPPLFPWLMLSPADPNSRTREFFSFEDEGVTLKLDVPAPHGRIPCCGSSQGWLMLQDVIQFQNMGILSTSQLLLVNPLSRTTIPLPLTHKHMKEHPPSLPLLIFVSFDKLVLSSSPTEHDCVAAALDSEGFIYFCKLGDHQYWTFAGLVSHDLVFYRGRFLGFDKTNQLLMVFELDHRRRSVETTTICQVLLPPEAEISLSAVYLVESGGELLLVLRRCSEHGSHAGGVKTTGFQVFMLDWIGSRWVRMDSLGDRILFLGFNSSLSISAEDFSCVNLKGNCIYFTDDNYNRYDYDSPECNDFGVFYLEDGRIEPCYPSEAHPPSVQFPPMWFTPDPH